MPILPRSGRAITEINVTPLVDVVLVLLIIFMATAPLMHHRAFGINLPKAGQGEAQPNQHLRLTLEADQSLLLSGKRISRAQLPQEISLRLRKDPYTAVAVNADGSLPYQEIISLLDLLKEAQVKKIALEVQAK